MRKYSLLCLSVVALIGGYFLHEKYTHNFHEVIAGEFYRSGQLSGQAIDEYTKKYGIKTIINLRAEQPNKSWYTQEVAAAEANGVKHIDFPLDGTKVLTRQQTLALIDVMRNAPKPLLVHCDAGTNRTGLASALYMAAIAQRDEFSTELQLSPIYGYFPIWFIKRFAMQQTYENIEPLYFRNS